MPDMRPGGTEGGGIDGLLFDGPATLGPSIMLGGVAGWTIVDEIDCTGDEWECGVVGPGVDVFDSPVSRLLFALTISPKSSGRSLFRCPFDVWPARGCGVPAPETGLCCLPVSRVKHECRSLYNCSTRSLEKYDGGSRMGRGICCGLCPEVSIR